MIESLWSNSEAHAYGNDPVSLRVYTSRLLGREPSLVLHGGGNTSVKVRESDPFGEPEELLYIKGSGWDLATIEDAGFAPVRLSALLKMARFETLSDADMVRLQRVAMTEPSAPTPSVEAILHAIIPFTFVDHTHADSVVAITNSPDGEAKIREIYGDKVFVIPYVMPGFILARTIYEMTRDVDWTKYEGMILLNHGVFSFADNARDSYESMVRLVNQAEVYLERKNALTMPWSQERGADEPLSPLRIATVRKAVSRGKGAPMIAVFEGKDSARSFASAANIEDIATRGCLTPDHIIRTKRVPVVLDDDAETAVSRYADEYRQYFARHDLGGLTMLDPAPRWGVLKGQGTFVFGNSAKEAAITSDIVRHTVRAIGWAEQLGGWCALPEHDLFEMEYWELEQAKLKKGGNALPLQGQIALVTGAASGIGKACVDSLLQAGACVAALDINPEVVELFNSSNAQGMVCDVTNSETLRNAVETAVRTWGGLDLVVCNAGVFPPSHTIADMDEGDWDRSLNLNLSSQQRLMQMCIPYLEQGWSPSIIVIGSKNVPAPGPGAGAYSVAKAGLNQLARVAALELAPKGIRVNTLHPNAVFDTALWTSDILQKRAEHYGLSVEEYKTNNLLGVEVTSKSVAAAVCALAGPTFHATTGAQIPVDGGNDRVI